MGGQLSYTIHTKYSFPSLISILMQDMQAEYFTFINLSPSLGVDAKHERVPFASRRQVRRMKDEITYYMHSDRSGADSNSSPMQYATARSRPQDMSYIRLGNSSDRGLLVVGPISDLGIHGVGLGGDVIPPRLTGG